MPATRGRPVAVVTGASSGIGLAVAESLAAAGYDVVLAANTPLARQRDIAARLVDSHGVRAAGFEVDIAERQSVATFASDVLDAFGAIDLLVNNAAIWTTTEPGVTALDEFDALVDVNLKGSYYVTHHFLPSMLDRGKGNIVFIGSVSGIAGDPNSAAYSATKAGVAMLTRTLAARLGPRGLRINAIAPGAVATPLTEALQTPAGAAIIGQMMKSHPSPTRRFFMDPAEIANLVLFLASDASSALHGAVLVADQGLSAALPA